MADVSVRLLALVYYAMGASTGVEVANFNLAYLCETNYVSRTLNVHRECKKNNVTSWWWLSEGVVPSL